MLAEGMAIHCIAQRRGAQAGLLAQAGKAEGSARGGALPYPTPPGTAHSMHCQISSALSFARAVPRMHAPICLRGVVYSAVSEVQVSRPPQMCALQERLSRMGRRSSACVSKATFGSCFRPKGISISGLEDHGDACCADIRAQCLALLDLCEL